MAEHSSLRPGMQGNPPVPSRRMESVAVGKRRAGSGHEPGLPARSPELRNGSLVLRNVSLELRNVSSVMRNVSLVLRNVSLQLRNVSLD